MSKRYVSIPQKVYKKDIKLIKKVCVWYNDRDRKTINKTDKKLIKNIDEYFKN